MGRFPKKKKRVIPSRTMRPLLLLLLRLIVFSFFVALGMVSEGIVDLLECLAHGYRMDNVHPFDFSHDKGLIVALGVVVVYVIGGLLFSLLGQETLLDGFKDINFRNQQVTIIAALIVAALVMGYFFDPICQDK